VSVRDLQNWNSISDPRKLRAGKTLTLFQSPAPAAVSKKSGPIKHTVQRGDSLWSIAKRYNVRVNDLMRWNDLSKNAVIQPGQSIKINL
jgi:membrane-bound lytic murein transglycosylase D